MRFSRARNSGVSLVEVLVAAGVATGVVIGGAMVMRGFTSGQTKVEAMRAGTEMYKALAALARSPEVLRTSAMTAPGVARPGNQALYDCLFPTQPPLLPNAAKCPAGVAIPFTLFDLQGNQRTGGAAGTAAAVGFNERGERCLGANCAWAATATFIATCETTLGNAPPASCDQALSIAADVAMIPNNGVFPADRPAKPIAERNVTGMRAVEVSRGEVRARTCGPTQRYLGTADNGEAICENLQAFTCTAGGPNLFLPGFYWGGDGSQPPRPEPNFCYPTALAGKLCDVGYYAVITGNNLSCNPIRTDGNYGIWRDAATNAAIDQVIRNDIQNNFAGKMRRCPHNQIMVGYDGTTGQVLCSNFELWAQVFNIPYVFTDPVSPANQFEQTFFVPFKPTSATCTTYETGHNALSYGVCGCYISAIDTANRFVKVRAQFNSDGPAPPGMLCMATVMAAGSNIF